MFLGCPQMCCILGSKLALDIRYLGSPLRASQASKGSEVGLTRSEIIYKLWKFSPIVNEIFNISFRYGVTDWFKVKFKK